MPRAKRYLEWAVFCSQDAAAAHEGLGDFYVPIKNNSADKGEYEIALQREPGRESVQNKLRGFKG